MLAQHTTRPLLLTRRAPPLYVRRPHSNSSSSPLNTCQGSSGMGKASTALSKRLHAYVIGGVQGVFFRSYTKSKAAELGLTGWVRNRRDGRVEVIAEGYEADLQQLLTWLHSGSPQADVSGVDATWGPASGEFDDFDTLWTA